MNTKNLTLPMLGTFYRSSAVWVASILGLIAMTAVPCQAASVSFYLNQSNHLSDDVNYLSVTLTENLTGGVDIRAQTLDPLNRSGKDHFGIQKFAFSFTGNTTGKITGLPDSWREKENRSMGGLGIFDVRLQGKSHALVDVLSFTVNDVDLRNFESLFAAQATGFKGKHHAHSAYFSGSIPTTPVPIPPAVWLLSSGLLGLVGVARRRRS